MSPRVLRICMVMCLALGCSNAPEDSSEDDNAGALTNRTGARGLSIDFVAVHDEKPAANAAPDDALRSCETDLEYVQISGTQNDAKINAILKEGNEPPQTCDQPDSLSSTANIRFLNPNFLSVVESGDYYVAGANHPSDGQIFKNIDVTTGQLATLDKILKPTAKDLILKSLRDQVGSQRVADPGVANGRRTKRLDPDAKDALLRAAAATVGNTLADLTDWSFVNGGIKVDLANHITTGLKSTDTVYLIKWQALAAHVQPAYKQRLGL